MIIYTTLFVFGLLVSNLIEYWLLQRHVISVKLHRTAVPITFQEKITLEQHQKAADYTLAKAKLGLLSMAIGIGLLLLWTLGGGLDLLDKTWRLAGWGPLTTGVFFILSTMIVMSTLDLPLSAYSTFVIEEKFGFNRSNKKIFFIDFIKETLLAIIIGLPLIWVILWLMESAGTLWWVYAWLVWMGFMVIMQWAFPTYIAPLFNKFSPLEDTELVTRITELLERCGFKSNGIYVMDGSTRSSHGNAYFSGFGSQKRIVFYDTILNSLNPNEIEAVLAHELGHFKHKHIVKRMISMALTSLIGLAVISWLMTQENFFHGLGVENPSNYMAIILFTLVAPIFSFLIQPISSYFSRKQEFEADDYAAKQSNANDLISALVKLYGENANTLTPDTLYSAYHDSHPPAPIRIAHLSSKLT